jgi:hypothetical protein
MSALSRVEQVGGPEKSRGLKCIGGEYCRHAGSRQDTLSHSPSSSMRGSERRGEIDPFLECRSESLSDTEAASVVFRGFCQTSTFIPVSLNRISTYRVSKLLSPCSEVTGHESSIISDASVLMQMPFIIHSYFQRAGCRHLYGY